MQFFKQRNPLFSILFLSLLLVVGVSIPFLWERAFGSLEKTSPMQVETLGVSDRQYDLNGDGLVNQTDMEVWLQAYRNYQQNGNASKGDLNQDGKVDAADSRLLVLELQETR